jgi:hypothetical protein
LVREFAEEKLVSAAEYSQPRDRKAEYFLRLVELRQGDLRTSSREAWSACLDAEVGNLRLAVQWWTDHQDYRALARLAWATLLHYWLRGRLRELAELLRAINSPHSRSQVPSFVSRASRQRLIFWFVVTAFHLAGVADNNFRVGCRDWSPARHCGSSVTLTLTAVAYAVDGVVLKRAVDAWVSAPASEAAARFASAETVRWLEEGLKG